MIRVINLNVLALRMVGLLVNLVRGFIKDHCIVFSSDNQERSGGFFHVSSRVFLFLSEHYKTLSPFDRYGFLILVHALVLGVLFFFSGDHHLWTEVVDDSEQPLVFVK